MADSHFNDPYAANNAVADRRQQDAQKFNQMVQMLAMANRASGQTMLGFALGRLLHDTWMNYKKKRDDDAKAKGASTTLGGEGETADQQAAEKLRQQNAAQLFAPYHKSLMDVAMANTYNGGRSVWDDIKQQNMQQAINGARRASTPEAQQFYADKEAHPEWFEGDYYVGGDPAAHIKWREENPAYAQKLAGKGILPTLGLVEAGNIDLSKRPIVYNPDGSYSTVESMSTNIDGNEVLIPKVKEDGSGILSDEDAIQQYLNTGHFLGKFSSPEAATNYALALHDQQAAHYAPIVEQQKQQALQRATQGRPNYKQDAMNAVMGNLLDTQNGTTVNAKNWDTTKKFMGNLQDALSGAPQKFF
ncbi:MAG: hypothetical protein PUE51_07645 [Veillonellaceae bacterium]|nr:hypothetical protein [Veillonellaceae bacterium]